MTWFLLLLFCFEEFKNKTFAFTLENPPIGAKLLCAVCKDGFGNPWDLMVHAQAAHMVNIYELGNEPNNNISSSNINNNNYSISTSNGSIISENHLTVEELDNNNILASNGNDKELNNNNLHCNTDNNDTNNNNNKNHNNGMPLSQPTITTTCFPMPNVKMQAPTQTSSLLNTNSTDVAILNATNGNNCNGSNTTNNSILSSSSSSSLSLLGDGSSSTSETDAHLSMELKFGICNSPIGSITNKEVSSNVYPRDFP